ncbi:MAG TPA: BBP7 family outer membrane beta-barrel protein [Gemmataceae bacterium]|nr:BBP7 family outer membrane beta-barrel protein [Gemmataceae bacterium]
MRKRFLLAITIALVVVGPLAAQPAPEYIPAPPAFPGQPAPPFAGPMLPADPVAVMPNPVVLRPAFDPDAYRIWVRAEALVWWVKNAPMPIAVTASDDPVNNPGGTLLNVNGNYGAFSGFRFAFGGWLDTNNTLGIETAIFTTEQRTHRFFANSDANGSPTIAFPFNSTTPGNEGSFILPISTPGQFSGSIQVASSLSLWGAELNGLVCIARTPNLEFSVLAGFRYLELQETLSIRSDSESLLDGTLTSFRDTFSTHNYFYGGQVGARLGWRRDRLSFDITGKLAVGGTHEVLNVQGNTAQFPGNSFVPNVYPGGFFAEPSNMGRTTGGQFAVVPSVELKFGYALTPFWKLYVGYDFLYWNQVVRPGSNVDTNLNLNQNPIVGNGTLAGPVSPAPLFNRTDFWAQGINVGLEFRY